MQQLVPHPDYEELLGSIDDIQTEECSVNTEIYPEKLFLHYYQQRAGCSKTSSSEFWSPVSYEGPSFASSCLDASNAIPTDSSCDNNLEISSSTKREQTKHGSELFKCPECGYCSSRKLNLSGHSKAVHLKEKPFRCSECEYCTATKNQLSLHIKVVHLKEKPFKCTECEYCAATKHKLLLHIKGVHLKEKPFKCTKCEYCAATKQNLSLHIKAIHLKENPFKCSECEYCAATKQHLSKHIRSYHLKE